MHLIKRIGEGHKLAKSNRRNDVNFWVFLRDKDSRQFISRFLRVPT